MQVKHGISKIYLAFHPLNRYFIQIFTHMNFFIVNLKYQPPKSIHNLM
jgi:hypothetical protein